MKDLWSCVDGGFCETGQQGRGDCDPKATGTHILCSFSKRQ